MEMYEMSKLSFPIKYIYLYLISEYLYFTLKAKDQPMKRGLTNDYLTDPRPVKYRNNAGFPERAVNMVLNYCAMTSDNLTFRYLHSKADMKVLASLFSFNYFIKFTYLLLHCTVFNIIDQIIKISNVYFSLIS